MAANFADDSGTSSDFLEWLYLRNPFGKAIGYIAYDGVEPVSQLFFVFQQAIFEGRLRTVAITSNACTMASHRGQGHFYTLMRRLLDDARELGMPFAWGYPNPHSLRTFEKANFRIAKQCSLELVPISPIGILSELRRKRSFTVDAKPDPVSVDTTMLHHFSSVGLGDPDESVSGASALPADRVWRVPLTREQLTWRYLEHPTRKYHVLLHRGSGHIVVLRFLRLFGLATGLVMKSNALDPRSYGRLLGDLKSDLRGQVNFLTTLPSDYTRPGLARAIGGRISVPAWLAPRKFPLAIHPLDDSMEREPSVGFDFVLGDYEAL